MSDIYVAGRRPCSGKEGAGRQGSPPSTTRFPPGGQRRDRHRQPLSQAGSGSANTPALQGRARRGGATDLTQASEQRARFRSPGRRDRTRGPGGGAGVGLRRGARGAGNRGSGAGQGQRHLVTEDTDARSETRAGIGTTGRAGTVPWKTAERPGTRKAEALTGTDAGDGGAGRCRPTRRRDAAGDRQTPAPRPAPSPRPTRAHLGPLTPGSGGSWRAAPCPRSASVSRGARRAAGSGGGDALGRTRGAPHDDGPAARRPVGARRAGRGRGASKRTGSNR